MYEKITPQNVIMYAIRNYDNPQCEGEKEFEELFTAEEGTAQTHHQKIHIAKHTSSISHDTIVDSISALEKFVHELSLEGCLTIMKDIVPSYEPSPMIRKKL